MKTRKEKALAEIKRRNAANTMGTSNHNFNRLLTYLMFEWVTPEGVYYSARRYYMKWNKKEYASFVSALQVHASRACFGSYNPLNCNNANLRSI